jgi:hypothetical protein
MSAAYFSTFNSHDLELSGTVYAHASSRFLHHLSRFLRFKFALSILQVALARSNDGRTLLHKAAQFLPTTNFPGISP